MLCFKKKFLITLSKRKTRRKKLCVPKYKDRQLNGMDIHTDKHTGWARNYRKYILQITQPSQYRFAKLKYRFAVTSGSPSTSRQWDKIVYGNICIFLTGQYRPFYFFNSYQLYCNLFIQVLSIAIQIISSILINWIGTYLFNSYQLHWNIFIRFVPIALQLIY